MEAVQAAGPLEVDWDAVDEQLQRSEAIIHSLRMAMRGVSGQPVHPVFDVMRLRRNAISVRVKVGDSYIRALYGITGGGGTVSVSLAPYKVPDDPEPATDGLDEKQPTSCDSTSLGTDVITASEPESC